MLLSWWYYGICSYTEVIFEFLYIYIQSKGLLFPITHFLGPLVGGDCQFPMDFT